MTGTLSNTRSLRARAATATAALLLVAATPAVGKAMGLEGVWIVMTQELNCGTGEPLPVPPTRALVTYHRGGTVTENRYIPVFAPGQLSDGHGQWRYAGWTTFTSRVVSMVQFTSPAGTPPPLFFQAGWQVATQTIKLDGPDSFSMTGTSEFLDLNGVVYRTGCAARTGQRFK